MDERDVPGLPLAHEHHEDEMRSETPVSIGPPPDGGREAWLVVFAAFFQQFCIFGMISANGQLQAYYLTHQLSHYPKSTVSWLGSIQTLLEFGGAMVSGRYFDVHGPRLLALSCLFSSFVSVIGLAFSREYYQFMLSFILFGIAAALIYAPSAAVASHWFDRNRGLAVGIIVCGSGVGGVIYPIMFEQLVRRLSYRDTMLIIAGFNFVLMLPGPLFMKSRLPPRRPPPWSDLKGPWKDPQYCFHVAGAACFGINLLTPFFAAIPYAQANHLPPNIVAYAITICLGSSIVGRLVLGSLADKLGVWRVYGTLGFAGAIGMFGLWAPPVGTAGTIVGLAWYGIVAGGWFTAVPAATAAISPLHESGMRFGMVISSLAIPSLIGPVISSALITAGNDSFLYAAIFCGCTYAVGGVLTIMAPLYRTWARRRALRKDPESQTVQSSERSEPSAMDVEDKPPEPRVEERQFGK